MRDRTADLFAASEALSQLSYSPNIYVSFLILHYEVLGKNGGRYRARTSDPLLVREVLSQLS